jgi:SHS family lactate transporter-like MFS transporter
VSELSPDSVRGTLPGLGNQIGVLIAGGLPYLEASLANGRSFAVAMAGTAAVVFLVAIVMTLVGRERRAVNLGGAR